MAKDYTGPIRSSGEDDSGVVDPDEDDDEDKGVALEYDDDDPNLVEAFSGSDAGKEYLKKLSQRVLSRFNAAWDGAEPYRERFKKDWALLECKLDKRRGEEHELKPHMPIMLKNITRLAFRAESELFGDWSRPIQYAPVGETPHDTELAEARTRHTNWQFSKQIPDFPRQMARGLMAFFSGGEVIARSYRDLKRGVNRHEVLTPDDFVMPYVYTSVMPDLSDVPWYAMVLRLYEHELLEHKDDWVGVDEVLDRVKPSWADDPDQPLREDIGKREGQDQEDTEEDSAPYKLIQYEGWEARMPGQERPRFVQVILDKHTLTILKLTIHEEPSLQELDRFDRETRDLAEYTVAMEHHDTMLAKATSDLDLAEQTGMPAPPEAAQALQHPPPSRPAWLGEDQDHESATPAPPKRDPIYLFSRAVNIENLAGNHGIGHGRMQAHYNRVGNTALREYTDAAAAANIPTWLMDDRLKIEGDKQRLKFEPGAMHKVSVPGGGKLSDFVIPFQAPAANPQLIDLAKLMDELAQESAQSPDVLSGEPGKSGETFRGLASRVEQAVKQLSVPTTRFAALVKQIAQNNARLNAIFMEDQEVVQVLDPQSNKYTTLRVGRGLYESGAYDVTITSDLRFVSKRERVAEADEILGMGKALPPQLAMQPGLLSWWWNAMRKALEARGMYDMVPSLGPAPPPPTTPFGLPPPPPPGSVPPQVQGQPTPPGGGPEEAPPPQVIG